jgi:hypothetical protein
MKRPVFRLIYLGFALGGALALLTWTRSALAGPDIVLSAPEASQTVAVRNVTAQDNIVSGEIINRSPRRLRDVQLQIRRIWHWNNEFRPGQNPPGYTDYYTIKEEIAPGGNLRFSYTLPSESPSRPDGHFETAVTVTGFAAIEEKRNDDDRRPAS